jgi:hypothetical protein
MVENFSLATLRALALANPPLYCHVTSKMYRPEELEEADSALLTSFPWLIVEHKKLDAKPTGQEYCQLANAVSAALHMYKRLAKYSNPRDDFSDIPPVVGVTTTAEAVKVWVGYISRYYEEENHVSVPCS